MASLFFDLEAYNHLTNIINYVEDLSSLERCQHYHKSVKAKGQESEITINQSFAGKSRDRNSGYYNFYSTLNLNEINKINIL